MSTASRNAKPNSDVISHNATREDHPPRATSGDSRPYFCRVSPRATPLIKTRPRSIAPHSLLSLHPQSQRRRRSLIRLLVLRQKPRCRYADLSSSLLVFRLKPQHCRRRCRRYFITTCRRQRDYSRLLEVRSAISCPSRGITIAVFIRSICTLPPGG